MLFLQHCNPRTLRPFGILFGALGTLGLAFGWWIKQVLHLTPGHSANAVDFSCGMLLGLGLALSIASFSSRMDQDTAGE